MISTGPVVMKHLNGIVLTKSRAITKFNTEIGFMMAESMTEWLSQ
jgi:hypothetical protein